MIPLDYAEVRFEENTNLVHYQHYNPHSYIEGVHSVFWVFSSIPARLFSRINSSSEFIPSITPTFHGLFNPKCFRHCMDALEAKPLTTTIKHAVVIPAFSQPHWQGVTNFLPYCIKQARSCVEASSSDGGVSYSVAVGICAHKMAVCSGSTLLKWRWSTALSEDRPVPLIVNATQRLATYRKALTTSDTETTTSLMPAVPPDCWQAFIRCVAMRGVYDDQTLGMCGHLMSICSDRGGRWPFGNDSSISWEQPYTNDTLQIYRNLYYYRREAETWWLNLTVFHPLCRKLMGQCVEASGGPASDVVIGRCGNQMGRCTFENVFLPHSYDGTNIYTTDYDRMWQRYSNIINPIFRWQDVTRFSFFCTDQFYGCVFASGGPSSDAAIGICGNRMSLCTFNDNNWPTISNPSTPFQTEPYDARLPLYRSMFEFMVPNVTSYSTFLALQILPNTTILPASTILSSRHHSAITTLLPAANFTLRFRGTRDGWSAQKFRTMCNGTAPNFAVFRTTTNFIFTAYSPIAFTTGKSGTPDASFYRSAPEDSTWLNNLESRTGVISTSRFFNTKQPQYTIFDASSVGPTYGYGHDIRTRDPMNINGTASEYTFKGSNFLAGDYNFNLTEMEFYHVTMAT